MRGAVLDFIRRFGRDLVPRNVSGKRFVTGLPRLALPTLVSGDDDFRLFHRRGQSFCRVGGFRRVAEVQLQLVRVFQIPLAAMAEGPLNKLVDGQLLLFHLLLQLDHRTGLLDDKVFGFMAGRPNGVSLRDVERHFHASPAKAGHAMDGLIEQNRARKDEARDIYFAT